MFNSNGWWIEEKVPEVPVLLKIQEIFSEFKKVNPDAQIDFSQFCKFWPKYVANVNSSCMHKVCV